MTSLRIAVEADGVVRQLDLFVQRLKGFDISDLGEELRTAIDDKIQAQGQVGSFPRWHELSPNTMLRRPGAHMLQRTGQLASIQLEYEGQRSVVAHSPAPYAGFHVTGTFDRDGEVRMPRRDFLELDMDAVLDGAGLRVLERLDY